jgi:hypothetical protein
MGVVGRYNPTHNPQKDSPILRGIIVAIWEERFRLLSPDGQGCLLTFSKTAPVGPRDLRGWRNRITPVRVRYNGQPNFVTGIAWSVQAEE